MTITIKTPVPDKTLGVHELEPGKAYRIVGIDPDVDIVIGFHRPGGGSMFGVGLDGIPWNRTDADTRFVEVDIEVIVKGRTT